MKGKRKVSLGFLVVDEAAQLVGLSHWTIRRWLQRGRLTKYKSASRTVVNRTELLDLLKPMKSRDGVIRTCSIQQQESSVNSHLLGDANMSGIRTLSENEARTGLVHRGQSVQWCVLFPYGTGAGGQTGP